MQRHLVRLILGSVLLVAAALLGLAVLQENRDVNTIIVIDAPVTRVWQVLSDAPRYADWNPLIRELSGDIRPGGQVWVSEDTGDGEENRYSARILGYETDHEIRWEHDLTIPRLFTGKRKLIIDPIAGGRTQLRHEEEFRGFLVGPLTETYLQNRRIAFEAMNQALKTRVESAAR